MNMHFFRWPVSAFLIIGLISCSANLELRKKQGESTRYLGEGYYRQGDYTSALKEFLKAEALYPDDPYLHYDLGLTYKAKKKFDLAVKHLEKAIELKPDYSQAKNALGTVYRDKKEWDTAIKYFKEASSNLLYTTPQYPLSNLGWAYYNKKEYVLAEKYYLDALAVDSRFVNALMGLAQTYMAMGTGRVPEAVERLEDAIRYYPQYPHLYFELGKAYTLLQNYEKATEAYEKVVELVPDSPLAKLAEKEAQNIRNLW